MDAGRQLVGIVLVMLGVATGWTGRAAARQVDQPDAGQTYEQVWDELDRTFWRAITELRAEYPSWSPDSAAARTLIANEAVVRRLMEATRLGPCHFEADSSEGWSQNAAHARELRNTGNLLVVDAGRLVAEERPDEAAERVAALLRLAGQLAADSRVASAVVAAALLQAADECVEHVLDAPALSTLARREMTVALNKLDEHDPAGYKAALTELSRRNDWIARSFKGAGAGEELVKSAQEADDAARFRGPGGGWDNNDRQERWRRIDRRGGGEGVRRSGVVTEEIRKLDGDGLARAAKDFDRMIDAAISVWDEPDAAERLAKIDTAADRNEFGLLARLQPASLASMRRMAERAQGSFDHLRLLLLAK